LSIFCYKKDKNKVELLAVAVFRCSRQLLTPGKKTPFGRYLSLVQVCLGMGFKIFLALEATKELFIQSREK